MKSHQSIQLRLVLLVAALCVAAGHSCGWTVVSSSSSAGTSGSFAWVANRISMGQGNNEVHFNIPGVGPHTIGGNAEFNNRHVNIHGQPNVILAGRVDLNSGGDLSAVRCHGAVVTILSNSATVANCEFMNATLYMFSSSNTYHDNNSFIGGGIHGRGPITIANVSNAIVSIDGESALVRNSHARVLAAAGTHARIEHCLIGMTNLTSFLNSHNSEIVHSTIAGCPGLDVGGHSNDIFDCHCYSNNTAIRIKGSYNSVRGCRIGLDPGGTQAWVNEVGVQVYNGDANVIGGTLDDDRNVISGNRQHNVHIWGGTDNRVEGNYIGTTPNGTEVLAHTPDEFCWWSGVFIDRTTNAIVGGVGRGNLISGNQGSAIKLDNARQARISHNLIGTTKSGLAGLPNGDGINGSYCDIVIIAANVIGSSTNGYGINLSEMSNVYVWGNFVGVNQPGTMALPNALAGIYLYDCADSVVGGTNDFNRNVVSGNSLGGHGIYCENFDSPAGRAALTIINNYIGVDSTGTNALGNSGAGIHCQSVNGVTIGGTNYYERNVISGNGVAGITLGLRGGPGRGNHVYGNFIGTDATGVRVLGGHSHAGVVLESVSSNFIGGTAPGMANVIAGGSGHGLVLDGFDCSDNHVVGNLVAHNASNGIRHAGVLRNFFFSNRFENNGLMAIDIPPAGYTYEFESNSQPNRRQHFPWLNQAVAGNSTLVEGVLTSAVSTTFTVECYAGPGLSAGGFSQGRSLGSLQVTTDGTGVGPFSHTFDATVPPGWYVSAIATDPDGNSSELGPPITASGVMASFSAAPLIVAQNDPVQFTDTSLGTPTAWAWDFDNDGSVDSTVVNPVHQYATPGQKSVALTVSNAASANTRVRTNLVYVAGAIHTIGPGTDLQVAVSAAAAGDVIALSNGVYQGEGDELEGPNVVVLDKDVLVVGSGGPMVSRRVQATQIDRMGQVIIDGEYTRRCAHVVSGKIVGVTFINGDAGGGDAALMIGGSGEGGGVLCQMDGEIERCIIRDCVATYGGGLAMYGGVAKSCLVVSNEAEEGAGAALYGGAACCNLTVADNVASFSAGGVYVEEAMLWNSIVYHNYAETNDNWEAYGATIGYCCSTPHPGDPHSISAPPAYLPDYSIDPLSPCVDRGENMSWMATAYDLPGDPRIQGDRVDMGAFEAIPEPAVACALAAALLALCMRSRTGEWV